MKTLIVGATRGVGRELALACARKGDSLVLAASNQDDLQATARDLQLRFNCSVETVAFDASDPVAVAEKFEQILPASKPPQNILLPIGASFENDQGNLNESEIASLLNINLTSLITIVDYYLPEMLKKGLFCNLAGFSSIAAIRGRGNNVVYSAAKRGLESYFESLRSLVADTSVSVQCYRLGYVDTAQTFGRQLRFPAASPERIAATVLKNFNKDIPLRHLPLYWKFVGFAVKHLPWFIYKRLNF
jgi:short-subunit dehydrogenase